MDATRQVIRRMLTEYLDDEIVQAKRAAQSKHPKEADLLRLGVLYARAGRQDKARQTLGSMLYPYFMRYIRWFGAGVGKVDGDLRYLIRRATQALGGWGELYDNLMYQLGSNSLGGGISALNFLGVDYEASKDLGGEFDNWEEAALAVLSEYERLVGRVFVITGQDAGMHPILSPVFVEETPEDQLLIRVASSSNTEYYRPRYNARPATQRSQDLGGRGDGTTDGPWYWWSVVR